MHVHTYVYPVQLPFRIFSVSSVCLPFVALSPHNGINACLPRLAQPTVHLTIGNL